MRKNLGKHQILETFWKATWTQHESNMHKNLRKHQVLETLWKATQTQHEGNMHKNIGFCKRFGKKHGQNMKATCENTRFLKRFGK